VKYKFRLRKEQKVRGKQMELDVGVSIIEFLGRALIENLGSYSKWATIFGGVKKQ